VVVCPFELRAQQFQAKVRGNKKKKKEKKEEEMAHDWDSEEDRNKTRMVDIFLNHLNKECGFLWELQMKS
jgi:hypothetical protein